jgi:hypothetical protein
MALQDRWTTEQIDIEAIYLNAELNEEIYIIDRSVTDKVQRLKKAMYGLKQAAHEWH